MNFAANFHGIATAALERLIYSVVAGTLLALAVWFLLQLFPKRDSRTSFVIWFSTLLSTAFLPLSLNFSRLTGNSAASANTPHAILTVSPSWAWHMFLAWALIAFAGLMRVAVATIQVRRLRAEATALDCNVLPEELKKLVEESQQARPVSLMISQKLEVPTAIGFRDAAVILPAWLLESTPAEQLKYIVLHELAHLHRRDDWTNLAQKILKAVFFFLPSVWWIERKLSLDREMACDDAVLAQFGAPRAYAECLAHVAERSFVRRQLALAQAAVGRVRQLTVRVAMILDPNRPHATQLWKPAVPTVIVLAGLSALPASFTSSLISFTGNAPMQNLVAQTPVVPLRQMQPSLANNAANTATNAVPTVKAIPASFNVDTNHASPLRVKAAQPVRRKKPVNRNQLLASKSSSPEILAASAKLPQQEYVTIREDMYFVVTQQTPTGEQQSLEMHIVQVSVQPQSKPIQKPRKI
jgi:beta-lactamase regulating signal transducer with metallopeptidase domain